jgi:hypothetical protein
VRHAGPAEKPLACSILKLHAVACLQPEVCPLGRAALHWLACGLAQHDSRHHAAVAYVAITIRGLLFTGTIVLLVSVHVSFTTALLC